MILFSSGYKNYGRAMTLVRRPKKNKSGNKVLGGNVLSDWKTMFQCTMFTTHCYYQQFVAM